MRIQTVVEEYGLTARRHGVLMRDVNQKVAERHATKRVPRHFRRNAHTAPGGPYGYLHRTRRHQERKLKLGMDPFRPNFMTGELMAAILSSTRITRTQYQWTWRATNAAFSWRPKSNQQRELEAISGDEIDSDTAYMARLYAAGAERLNKKLIRRHRRG